MCYIIYICIGLTCAVTFILVLCYMAYFILILDRYRHVPKYEGDWQMLHRYMLHMSLYIYWLLMPVIYAYYILYNLALILLHMLYLYLLYIVWHTIGLAWYHWTWIAIYVKIKVACLIIYYINMHSYLLYIILAYVFTMGNPWCSRETKI